MNNPKFAGAIEQAIRNAATRTTANICQPHEGQLFDSPAEAYQFYNLHAWESGFSIRLGRSQKNRTTRVLNMQEFDASDRLVQNQLSMHSKIYVLHRVHSRDIICVLHLTAYIQYLYLRGARGRTKGLPPDVSALHA